MLPFVPTGGRLFERFVVALLVVLDETFEAADT
jgi:hypothetical protein